MQQNIIILGNVSWFDKSYAKAIVELSKELAKNHNVVFIDYSWTFKDVFQNLLGQKYVPTKKVFGLEGHMTCEYFNEDQNKIWIFQPPASIPINFIESKTVHDSLNQYNIWSIAKSIDQIISALNLPNYHLLNAFNPHKGVDLIRRLYKKPLTYSYYCYDEISQCDWLKKHGPRLELKLLKEVSHVFCTSPGLVETKSKINPNCTLVPNGVNFELFNSAFTLQHENVIGFIGSLDHRIDYDLLDYAMEQIPNDWYLVGRIAADCRDRVNELMQKHLNCEVLGAQPQAKLPQIIDKFAVGVIPFVKSEFNKNVYPLKINEYFAAGMPVVSTAFANLMDLTEHTLISSKPDQFVAYIRLALNQGKSANYCKIAQNQTWQARAQIIENKLFNV